MYKMKQYYISCIIFIIIISSSVPLAGKTDNNGYGLLLPLWSISRNGATVFLLPSFHSFYNEHEEIVYPLHSVILDAFNKAQKIYIEHASLPERDELLKLLRDCNAEEGTLTSTLITDDEKTMIIANSFFTPYSPDDILNLKPWAASILLRGLKYRNVKKGLARGIDKYFLILTKQVDKEVGYLEDYGDVFNLLDTLSETAQISMLRNAIPDNKETIDIEVNKEKVLQQLQWWKKGKFTQMDKTHSSRGTDPIVIELYMTYMAGRNRLWVKTIESEMLSEEGTYFVIGGLGHFIGKDNVFELLRKKGYLIRQYAICSRIKQ